MHGHSYRVRVSCRGYPDPHTGMVCDYADITASWREHCHNRLDHGIVNDILGDQATAERLAIWIWAQIRDLPELWEVEVCETRNTSAIYAGPSVGG